MTEYEELRSSLIEQGFPFKRSCVLKYFRILEQFNPRKFRRESHQDSDLICRLEAIRLFYHHPTYKAVLAEDYYPEDEEVQYKADIALVNRVTGAHEHCLEVEMKRSWVDEFPYKDIQFLPRKKEKWDDPKFTFGKPTHWVLFNRDASQHLVIFDSVIRNISDVRMVSCQVRGLEELYTIPTKFAYLNYLNEKTYEDLP